MDWFIVMTLVTVFWGNGATEEARVQWQVVFRGTRVQCETYAARVNEEENKAWARTLDAVNKPDVKHAIMPRLYYGGIKRVAGLGSFCVEFQSANQIKSTFSKSSDAMSGVRFGADGNVESYAWWQDTTSESGFSRP